MKLRDLITNFKQFSNDMADTLDISNERADTLVMRMLTDAVDSMLEATEPFFEVYEDKHGRFTLVIYQNKNTPVYACKVRKNRHDIDGTVEMLGILHSINTWEEWEDSELDAIGMNEIHRVQMEDDLVCNCFRLFLPTALFGIC